MYLKRLDLHGFKSFPEKVKLEFNKGITAVVGPNGSGKSNISDSVRWVLGEQRAKSLRGDKMEDIIFAGTQNRKPLGFAEVSITLDNVNREMPIDYTEVTVTRRVFRSGESDYLINGTNCRLKDIQELFMDTGVGREGYSIIGQGKIDEILSTKGDDRRKLFEEAAGIVKYKNRRSEAAVKLEKERQNLIRIEDILSELESQIEPLGQQSETAKRFLALKERLKAIDVNLFRVQADKTEAALNAADENYKIVSGNLAEEEEAYTKSRQKNSALKECADSLTKEIEAINEALIEVRTEAEKEEGALRLTTEQIQNIKENMLRLEKEIQLKRDKIESGRNEIQLYQTKLSALSVSMTDEQNKMAKKEAEFAALNKNLSENESQMEQYKADMIEKIKITTDVKGNISRTQAMLEQFQQRKGQVREEKGYLQSQITDDETHIQAAAHKIRNYEAEEKTIQDNLSALELNRAGLREKLAENEKALNETQRKLTDRQSRFRILSEMEKEHEGFYRSVKSILKQKEDKNPNFNGIRGAVGELLVVDKKFETAVEIALGGSVQSIITENEEAARASIDYLKANSLGRATFLPMTSVKGKGLEGEKYRFEGEKGYIGIAKNLVEYDKAYEGVMASLLGKILVMENLKDAVAFSKKFRYSYKVVTLEGDIINPGGAMTGGSIAKKSTNIFGRSREIKELSEEISSLTGSLQEYGRTKEYYLEKSQEIKNAMEEMDEESRGIHIQILSAKQDIEQTENILQEHRDKLSSYLLEEDQLKEQYDGARLALEKDTKELEGIEKEIEEINQRLSSFQDSLESEKSNKDDILNALTEMKIAIANFEQSKGTVLENIRRIQRDIKASEAEISNLTEEIDRQSKVIEDKERDIAAIQERIAQHKEAQQEKQKLLGNMADKRKEINNAIAVLEEKHQEKIDAISSLKGELIKLEGKKEKLLEERQRIYSEIWEEYEITYQMAKDFGQLDIPDAQLLRESKALRGEIRELGSVNVDAIEQYRETKTRFEFLTGQKDDIQKAEEELQGVISELSSLMETQFKEQFALISANFNEVFREMFGGGKAYLKLSDEENVLESGIEIIAQPPGKNLQNMMLLSGGERALTAIAILFSILKMKPSPFCILDEIEAALDDANVKRFANYLKAFSGDTQFIVITHRKGTMEAADVMYGVTMQEQGVSKLVSVKFSEAAAV